MGLKYRLGYDDSLDVVGVHLVGGATGALLIGQLANSFTGSTGGVYDLLYGGGPAQPGRQAVAVVAVGVYAFVLAYAIDRAIGFRVRPEDEVEGVDTTQHAWSAYELSLAGAGGPTGMGGGPLRG